MNPVGKSLSLNLAIFLGFLLCTGFLIVKAIELYQVAKKNPTNSIGTALAEKQTEVRELGIVITQVTGEIENIEKKMSSIRSASLPEDGVDELLARLEAAATTSPVAPEGESPDPSARNPLDVNRTLAREAVELHDRLFEPLREVSIGSSLDYSSLYLSWATKLKLIDREVYGVAEGDAYPGWGMSYRDSCKYESGYNLAPCINLLTHDTSADAFGKRQRQMLADLEARKQRLEHEQAALEGAQKDIAEIQKELVARSDPFDGLIMLGAPALALATVFIYWVSGHQTSSTPALPTVTVLLLVSAIVILGLADKLDRQVLGTLIGGISGYVLGKLNVKESPPGPPPNGGEPAAKVGEASDEDKKPPENDPGE